MEMDIELSEKDAYHSDIYADNDCLDLEDVLACQANEIYLQRQQLASLAQGFQEVVQLLKQQCEHSLISDIKQVNDNLLSLGKITVSVYKQMQKHDNNVQATASKADLQKVYGQVRVVEKNVNSKLRNCLEVKNMVMVVILTSVFSSLITLAVAKVFLLYQGESAGLSKPAPVKMLKNKG
jgi:tRNA U55 pseudouridine synthase TruB